MVNRLKQRLPHALKARLRRPYYRFKHRRARHRNQEKLKMENKVKWGIIGTGAIARIFAEGLSFVEDAQLVAVGSRKQATADSFAKEYGVPKAYPTYEALAQDPNIEMVYISTPHPMHKENALLCIENGKGLLVEKPFTLNRADTEEVIKAAREKQVFMMEAMWTRFIPAVVQVRKLIAEGVIGEVRMFHADFGFDGNPDPKGRLLNPELGGGALLDVGIYPISFAWMVLGEPQSVSGYAYLGDTGVDEQFAGVFHYAGGQLATVAGSVTIDSPREAVIMGTKGQIRVHYPFWFPEKLTVSVKGTIDNVLTFPVEGSGYRYEAEEVARCLAAGKLESEIMPLDESAAIMGTLDELRRQWGLRYPGESGV